MSSVSLTDPIWSWLTGQQTYSYQVAFYDCYCQMRNRRHAPDYLYANGGIYDDQTVGNQM